MISCKTASQLASEALDRDLRLGEKVRLRLHLAMCRMCFRYARQIRWLRRWMRTLARKPELLEDMTMPRLSEEARERLRILLQEHALETGPDGTP